MEELRPEELEALVQELEGESSAQQPPPLDIDELLRVLHTSALHLSRREAAEQLGRMGTSNSRIIRSLVAAYESDSYAAVSQAAVESLRAPVHQEYLRQHPDLLEEVERALRRGSRADKQLPGSDAGGLPAGEEVVGSFLSRAFHDPRWKWAPVYAVLLLVTTALLFVVDSVWALGAAGVVWFAGSVLGLIILQLKGHLLGGSVFDLLNLFDDTPAGCFLVVLALFALAGPVILLVALFKRPRGFAGRMSKQRATAKPAGRRKEAAERGPPSDCPHCGAWNAPDSEHCGECGLSLQGSAA